MQYSIIKVNADCTEIFDNLIYQIPSLKIENYLWMNNNYQPKVEVKLCYSEDSIFIFFKVFEKEITANFTQINDFVYKESCVEFFINLFPNETNSYFNFEVNAIGTIYVAFGNSKTRKELTIEEINRIKIQSSQKEPFVGKLKSDYWEVKLQIPFNIMEKYYNKKFERKYAKANFYKCGDETKFPHFGCWNKVISDKPNFHLPEYFGDIYFE
jgi:hypothetical protein